jgi:hypothetical protein
MVATHWVEMIASVTSASGSEGVVLESLVTIPRTEGATIALAPAVGSSVVV